jgi:chromosome segregation ATPase
MSDHIPDVMKMLDETPCKATPREELRNQIMSSIIPKNEREWWAKRTIEQIERELNAANERIEALNRGNAAAERILCELTGCESGRDVPDWIVKKNWELTDLSKAYLELVHKHTLTEERIKRLEEAVESIQEYWNRDNNERAMEDACWNAWTKAKEAK